MSSEPLLTTAQASLALPSPVFRNRIGVFQVSEQAGGRIFPEPPEQLGLEPDSRSSKRWPCPLEKQLKDHS